MFESYQASLYHVLDLEKLEYVLKNDQMTSYKAGNGYISLTRDVMLNGYLGDSPLSILKLELDAQKLRSKYKIRPFSYVSNTGIRFDEREEQVQSRSIKPIFPYIKRIILIKSRVESLLNPSWTEHSSYATTIGTRNGTIRDIIAKVIKMCDDAGFELYVQDNAKIEKNENYLEHLLNYPIKNVEQKYSVVHRGYIKNKSLGFSDVLIDLDKNIIKDHFVGMELDKNFKAFDKDKLPKLFPYESEGEKFVPYLLNLHRKDNGNWKLADLRPIN